MKRYFLIPSFHRITKHDSISLMEHLSYIDSELYANMLVRYKKSKAKKRSVYSDRAKCIMKEHDLPEVFL